MASIAQVSVIALVAGLFCSLSLSAQTSEKPGAEGKSRAELQKEVEDLKQNQKDLEARLGALEKKESDDLEQITEDDGAALAGWDGQFYICDKSGQYQLNIGAYTQFRWDMNHREDPPPGNQPGNLQNFNSVTLGVNFLPFEFTNKYKLTLETSLVLDSISNTIVSPAPGLGYLPSMDDGQFLLRLQLQFGF